MLSACGQVLNEAELLHFRYGSRVALSTLSPICHLLGLKTRFPVRRLHLLSGREFHPLEAPGLSWRTVLQNEMPANPALGGIAMFHPAEATLRSQSGTDKS